MAYSSVPVPCHSKSILRPFAVISTKSRMLWVRPVAEQQVPGCVLLKQRHIPSTYSRHSPSDLAGIKIAEFPTIPVYQATSLQGVGDFSHVDSIPRMGLMVEQECRCIRRYQRSSLTVLREPVCCVEFSSPRHEGLRGRGVVSLHGNFHALEHFGGTGLIVTDARG